MISTGGNEIVGGAGGFGFGGFGGGGILEGLILGSLLGNRRGGGLFGGDGGGGSADLDASGIAAKVVELQNSSNILAEIGRHKECMTGEFRGINAGLFAVNDSVKDGNYAAAIQAERNTNQLSNQATAFQVANDAKFEALSRQVAADGDATRNLITQNIIESLREQVEREREHRQAKEQEINIINTNTNVNQQFQAQAQVQNQRDFENQRRFDALFTQVARATNSNVIVGNTGASTTGAQTASPTNVNA